MSDGSQQEIIHKTRMEQHIIQAHETKYHPTEGHRQLHCGQLLKDVGLI